MPTETPVDNSQNEEKSPKQADCLDAPSSCCKAHQKSITTLLGSGVGIPGGEARSQFFHEETELCGHPEGQGVKEP